jgi:hypothetical protein
MKPGPSPLPQLPSSRDALRQAGGFALLAGSLWLVGLLALGRAVIGIFH